MHIRDVLPRDAIPSVEAPAFGPVDEYVGVRDGTLSCGVVSWGPATGRSADGDENGRRPTRAHAPRLYAFVRQDDHEPGSFYGLD